MPLKNRLNKMWLHSAFLWKSIQLYRLLRSALAGIKRWIANKVNCSCTVILIIFCSVYNNIEICTETSDILINSIDEYMDF